MPEKLDDDGNPIEEEDPPEEVPPLRSLAEDTEGSWGFRTCPAGESLFNDVRQGRGEGT